MTDRLCRLWAICMVLVAAVVVPNSASASTVAIFGTGLDGGGVALALGATDPHYAVVETTTQAQVISVVPGLYLPNDANSQWIWQSADGMPINVSRTFRTTFDLTGLNPSTASIIGQWGADNTGLAIVLNGNTTGYSLPGSPISNFNPLHPFTLNSPSFFVSGINTLDFVVLDVGGVSGFRAEMTGTADPASNVPEPSAFLLLASGLVGVAARRRIVSV